MKSSVLLAFVSAIFLTLLAIPANAQATRTWISGVGDDANPCSRTAPCKTFAGAISKTSAGGEIDNLDTGGYGALTITKAITLDGGGGQVASVLVAGTAGITVAAGSSDVVTIRNIHFQGVNGSGTVGIKFVSGKALIVENCVVEGFSQGGILFSPGAGAPAAALGTVTNTLMSNNEFGLKVQDNASVTVSNSAAINNTNGGFLATSTSTAAKLNLINDVTASNGASGIVATGTNASVNMAYVSILQNGGTGINISSGGTVTSVTPATSANMGNATPGAPNGTAIPLQ